MVPDHLARRAVRNDDCFVTLAVHQVDVSSVELLNFICNLEPDHRNCVVTMCAETNEGPAPWPGDEK
ncbi:MAG: hypothetical protein JWN13_2422 [Betaproteobacteria bacterium]|jgi:hypothetical protein|nr:hypothetical protein [Betaproteobacteria bacterium]